MTSPSTSTTLLGLRLAITSTASLLQKYDHAIAYQTNTPTTAPTNQSDPQPEPLVLLHTSATLTKAQTTKLSLLILNKPFTPTAISAILRDLSAGPLVAMMSGVQLCVPDVWGTTMSVEVKSRVLHVLRELRGLVGEIPLQEPGEGESQEGAPSPSKGSLASTGVVWEACDALAELRDKGMAGLLVQKAIQYRDTLEDALAELSDWSKEDGNDDADKDEYEDEDEDDDDDASSTAGNDSFDDLFDTGKTLPKGDSELRSLLDDSLKRLALVKMLYTAVIKRRLRHASLSSASAPLEADKSAEDSQAQRMTFVSRLDRLMQALKSIPEETDELASAFYELDEEEARRSLQKCLQLARDVAELVKRDWSGREDDFKTWLDKWLGMIGTE
ncbi:MAG: hypothetical protein M1837_001783 [Sclerophora amabilis]|nr:MAG: hypothetical protein M1837_001783 [Sclerophora amabilis]